MVGRTLWEALRASVTRWRAALAVLAIIGLPMALPFILLELVGGLLMRDGAGDPILQQHLLWVVASPEAVTLFFGLWLLLFGPWAIGIWGISGQGARLLRIGVEAYAFYLVLLLCVAGVLLVNTTIVAFLAVYLGTSMAVDVALDCVALYVFLRLAPSGSAIRDQGRLDLRAAWRGTAPEGWRILGLAVAWTGLGLVLLVAAQIIALGVSTALSSAETGPSWAFLMVRLGAPGLITGTAAAYIALVSIALFWSLAERERP